MKKTTTIHSIIKHLRENNLIVHFNPIFTLLPFKNFVALIAFLCLIINGYASLLIKNSPPCTMTATTSVVQNVSCSGGSNGEASVTESGGTSPFTYLWSPGGQTDATAT